MQSPSIVSKPVEEKYGLMRPSSQSVDLHVENVNIELNYGLDTVEENLIFW